MSKVVKSKEFKQVVVLILILTTFFSIFVKANAIYTISGLSSNSNSEVWENLYTKADLGENVKEYPKDSILPLNVIFGTSKGLVRYTGEVPFGSKDALSDIGRLPSREHKQSIFNSVNITNYEEFEDYATDGGDKPLNLRIYAVNIAKPPGLFDVGYTLGNVLYVFQRAVVSLLCSIVNLLISIKNITIPSILADLGLKSLVEFFNGIFVIKNGEFSFFWVLAITVFILNLIGYAINYARAQKKSSLGSLVLVFVIGISLTLMYAYSPDGAVNLGVKMANFTETVIASVQNEADNGEGVWSVNVAKNNDTIIELTLDESGNAIETEATDETKARATSSMDVSLREQAYVTKPIIDIQLTTQFGSDVWKDDTFNTQFFDKLDGDYKLPLAKNIGEWFWIADSPAKYSKYTSSSKTIVNNIKNGKYVSEQVQINRMDKMIDAMQDMYDNEESTTQIKQIMQAFANPNPAKGSLKFFLMIVVYVLLFINIFALVFKILLSKVIAGASITLLPVGGLLMMTTKDKLVSYGKAIGFLMIVYSIQTFFLCVVFDIILHIVGLLIGPGEYANILLTIAVLIGLRKFIGFLMAQLDSMMSSIRNAISRDSNQLVKSVKGNMQRGLANFRNSWNKKTRTVRVKKADGTYEEREVSREGGLISTGLALASNSFLDSANRQSGLAVIRDNNRTRREEDRKAYRELSETMTRENKNKEQEMKDREERLKGDVYGTDAYGRARDNEYDNLSETSFAAITNASVRNMVKSEMSSISRDENTIHGIRTRLAELQNKHLSGKSLTPAEIAEYEKLSLELQNREFDIKGRKRNVVNAVDEAIHQRFLDENGNELKEYFAHQLEANTDFLAKGRAAGKRTLQHQVAEGAYAAKKGLDVVAAGGTIDEMFGSLTDDEKSKAHGAYGEMSKKEFTAYQMSKVTQKEQERKEQEAQRQHDERLEAEIRLQRGESAELAKIDAEVKSAERAHGKHYAAATEVVQAKIETYKANKIEEGYTKALETDPQYRAIEEQRLEAKLQETAKQLFNNNSIDFSGGNLTNDGKRLLKDFGMSTGLDDEEMTRLIRAAGKHDTAAVEELTSLVKQLADTGSINKNCKTIEKEAAKQLAERANEIKEEITAKVTKSVESIQFATNDRGETKVTMAPDVGREDVKATLIDMSREVGLPETIFRDIQSSHDSQFATSLFTEEEIQSVPGIIKESEEVTASRKNVQNKKKQRRKKVQDVQDAHDQRGSISHEAEKVEKKREKETKFRIFKAGEKSNPFEK